MGNCLTCFKEPPSAAQQKNSPYCKEDMPDVRLYSAPNHNYQDNNHHQHYIQAGGGTLGASLGSLTTSATSGTGAVIHTPFTGIPLSSNTSCNATTLETSLIGNGNQLLLTANEQQHNNHNSTSALSRLCAPYQRRPAAALTSPMGGADSKAATAGSDSRLHALFDQYRDDIDVDTILAEGVEQLCKDLLLSPDEFRVLLFAWQLNAEQMCRFTRTEFICGLKQMHCDSLRTIQTRLPELAAEVQANPDLFKDLYRFTFRFGLDVPAGQRILPTDMAVLLWRLVFTVREPPILRRWLAFLQSHEMVRGIPKDTWNMFLNFSDTVGNDLSSYDDNEAWPSLFDDFVEFENDQANQNISKEKDCNKRDEETNCSKPEEDAD